MRRHRLPWPWRHAVSRFVYAKNKDEKFFLSGTQVRQMLEDGVDIPEEFTRPEVAKILQDSAKAKVIKELQLQRHRASGDARILQETYRRTERVAA